MTAVFSVMPYQERRRTSAGSTWGHPLRLKNLGIQKGRRFLSRIPRISARGNEETNQSGGTKRKKVGNAEDDPWIALLLKRPDAVYTGAETKSDGKKDNGEYSLKKNGIVSKSIITDLLTMKGNHRHKTVFIIKKVLEEPRCRDITDYRPKDYRFQNNFLSGIKVADHEKLSLEKQDLTSTQNFGERDENRLRGDGT